MIHGNASTKDNLLKNGDFSLFDKAIPTEWRFYGKDKGQGEIHSDKEIFHRKPQSLRFTKSDKKGRSIVDQYVKISPESVKRQLLVSAWVRSENSTPGAVTIVVKGSGGTKALWDRITFFGKTMGWEKISKIIEVPADTNLLGFVITFYGNGQVWLDDCSMSFIHVGENAIKNASLSGNKEISGLPVGWTAFNPQGNENLSKYQIKTGIEPELTITYLDGGGIGGAKADLKYELPAGNYLLKALTKTSGDSSAVLLARTTDRNNIDIDIISTPQKSNEWQESSCIFNCKPNDKVSIIFQNHGSGESSFKNFSLTETNKKSQQGFPIQTVLMPIAMTKIWKGVDEFNSFIDAPVPLTFDIKGIKGTENILVIDIPHDLKITEAFNYHTVLNKKALEPTVSPIIYENEKYTRYKFINPSIVQILTPTFSWGRRITMAIEPKEENITKDKFTVYYHWSVDGVNDKIRQFTLNLLPGLPKVQLANFPFYHWRLLDVYFNDLELRGRVASNFEKAGLNYRFLNDSGKDDFYRERGWKCYTSFAGFERVTYYPKELDIESVRMSEGLSDGVRHICPSYMIKNENFKVLFKKFTEKLFSSSARSSFKNGDVILGDIEPFKPLEWCFCQECREDFCNKNNFTKLLSKKEIQNKHAEEWVEFRCIQTAQIIEMSRKIARKIYPNSPFYEYDYTVNYKSPKYRESFKRVAKDPESYDNEIDGHLVSYYHHHGKKAFDLMDSNIKRLKSSYFVTAAIDKIDYLRASDILSPDQMKMTYLAAAFTGAKGFSVYPGECYDGLFLKMFNESNNKIAKVEHFTKHGKGKRVDGDIKLKHIPLSSQTFKQSDRALKMDIPNWDEYAGKRVYADNNQLLLALFNYNNKTVLFSKLDDNKLDKNARYTILMPFSNKRLLLNHQQYIDGDKLQSVILKTNPMDVSCYIFRKYLELDNDIPAISCSEWEKELEVSKKQYQKNAFKPLKSGDLQINLSDDGISEVTISNKTKCIGIATQRSATVVTWKQDGIVLFGDDKTIPASQQVMLEDRFWLPTEWRGPIARQVDFHIKNGEIKNNRAILVFEKEIKEKKLVITKTYTLHSDKDSPLTMKLEITNKSHSDATLSYWLHNFVGIMQGDVTASVFKTIKGDTRITGRYFDEYFPVETNIHPDFPKAGTMLQSGVFSIENTKNGNALNITCPLKDIIGAYSWCQSSPSLEWMYKSNTIQPQTTWTTIVSINSLLKK